MPKNIASRHLLQALIDFFEAGNQESDEAAKAVIASDCDFRADWRGEIERLQTGADWTGLRAPEAELLAAALRRIQQMLPPEA